MPISPYACASTVNSKYGAVFDGVVVVDQPWPLHEPAAGLPVPELKVNVPPLLEVVAEETFAPRESAFPTEDAKSQVARVVLVVQLEGPPVGAEVTSSVSLP